MGQPPPWITEYIYEGRQFRLVQDDRDLWRIFSDGRYLGAVIEYPPPALGTVFYVIDLPGEEGAAGVAATTDWHDAVETLIRLSQSSQSKTLALR